MRHAPYLSTNSTLRALWLGAVVGGVLFGCADLFGIEPSTRRSNFTDGGGGGEAGDGLTSGGGSGRGGSSTRGGAGGQSTGGTGTAGSVSGNGGAGASGGGTSGSGGGAGDESCGSPDAVACSSTDSRAVLKCVNGVWIEDHYCEPSQEMLVRCNPRSGTCETVSLVCRDHPQGLCRENGAELVDCANDLFSPLTHRCPYGCENGACLPGTGDALIVHTERHEGPADQWPSPIPVCFAPDDSPELPTVLRTWTRRAVERSFARYLNVSFAGWETCPNDDVPGVVVEFLENCRGRLAGAVELGHRGSYQSRVGICRTFYDGGGTLHELEHEDNADLADFLARHQFGHVLGLQEDVRDASPTTVISSSMVPALRLSRIDKTVWARDIAGQSRYGYKPAGTLGTETGQCLSTENEVLSLDACSSSATQQFQFRSTTNALQSVASAECLLTTPSDGGASLGFGACPNGLNLNPNELPPDAFALRRMRFHTPGHCLFPRNVGTAVVLDTRPCGEFGDPGETWSFEFVDVDEDEQPRAFLRIPFQGQYYCVTEAGPFTGPYVPPLYPCDARSTVFTLGPEGAVSFALPNTNDRVYLSVGDDSVSFRTSSGYPLLISGPIEDGSGHALAITPGDSTAPPTISSLEPDATPRPEQVFDVHF